MHTHWYGTIQTLNISAQNVFYTTLYNSNDLILFLFILDLYLAGNRLCDFF